LFIKSYAYERFQRVLTDNTVALDKVSYSNWEDVGSGVSQGSGLALGFFFISMICPR
jgi:hypothetical protein